VSPKRAKSSSRSRPVCLEAAKGSLKKGYTFVFYGGWEMHKSPSGLQYYFHEV
jgi:hypothetical protein